MGAKISFIENKSSPLKGIGKHSNLKLKTEINIIFLYIMIVYYLRNLI